MPTGCNADFLQCKLRQFSKITKRKLNMWDASEAIYLYHKGKLMQAQLCAFTPFHGETR